MPYVKYVDAANGLLSMREAAAKLGMGNTLFWRLVRSEQVVPKPTTCRGGRFFYSPDEFRAVELAVGKLQQEGKVK